MTGSPSRVKNPPPAPSGASRGCLPGCSAVIYWRLFLVRAHGRRSSNTRKKSHPLLIPTSDFPSARGHSSRSPGAGAAALPFFFLSSASQVIPPGCAPLPGVTRRARRATAGRGGGRLCLQPLSGRSLSRSAPRGWSRPLWARGFGADLWKLEKRSWNVKSGEALLKQELVRVPVFSVGLGRVTKSLLT